MDGTALVKRCSRSNLFHVSYLLFEIFKQQRLVNILYKILVPFETLIVCFRRLLLIFIDKTKLVCQKEVFFEEYTDVCSVIIDGIL